MKATITYKEISDLIEKEYNIRPKFSATGEKGLEASYKAGFLMPTITIKLHIEAVRRDAVYLSYDCGEGAALMIAGAIAYLKEKLPSGIEINTTDKRVNIYPGQFKQLEKALEYVTLSDISFDEENVKVSLSMV